MFRAYVRRCNIFANMVRFAARKEAKKIEEDYKSLLIVLRDQHYVKQQQKIREAKRQKRYHIWKRYDYTKAPRMRNLLYPKREKLFGKPLYSRIKKIRKKLKKVMIRVKRARMRGIVAMKPLFIFLARTRLNGYMKAAMKRILRSIPFFCRFIMAVRVPHNGIRKRKQRRM